MKSLQFLFAGLLALSLSANAVIYVVLKEEVKATEERLQLEMAARPAPGQPTPTHDVPGTLLLESRVAGLEQRLDRMNRRLPASSDGAPRRPGSGDGSTGETTDPTQGADDMGGPSRPAAPGSTAALHKKLERLEKELAKVQAKVQKEDSEPKPRFDTFAARLELDPTQVRQTQQLLERGQTDMLEIMKRPLPDGSNLADELAEAFSSAMDGSDEGKQKVAGVFQRLVTEKVPGTEKTYLETMEEMNRRLADDMCHLYSPSQVKKFREWGPKPSDIELDGGPFQQHIFEYMKRKKAEEENR